MTEVLDLCRSMATSARIFSFGLGHSPSRSLVKGLARATNGRFVFVPPKSDVDTYVGEQLQKALQSCITDVEIRWNSKHSLIQAPTEVPPVYNNDRLIFYALANDPMAIFSPDTSVELFTGKHRISEAKMVQIPSVSHNGTIARLAAKALILELQHAKLPSPPNQGSLQSRFERLKKKVFPKTAVDKDEVKKRIIELSLKHHILSPHTAFVGVEKRIDGNNADMVLREVPIQISADDQHLENAYVMQCASFKSASINFGSFDRNICFDEEDCMLEMSSAPNMLRSLSDDMDSELFDPSFCFVWARTECHVDRDYQLEETFAKLEEMFHPQASTTVKSTWPTTDADIVRRLINEQSFDGLWNFDATQIEQLTGKELSNFPQSYDAKWVISAIIIVTLETRFASLSSLWFGVVQKARKHLTDLLGKDANKLNDLLNEIKQKL